MSSYTRTRIWLHWVVVALVLLQWLSADGIERALAVLEREEAPNAWDFLLSNLHLFGGGLLFLLTIWRLHMRYTTNSPEAIGSQFLQRLAAATHWGLLIVLLALPISGALSYYQWAPVAGQWHEWAGWLLFSLILLHLLGGVWHSLQGQAIWHRMVTIGAGKAKSVDADSPPE